MRQRRFPSRDHHAERAEKRKRIRSDERKGHDQTQRRPVWDCLGIQVIKDSRVHKKGPIGPIFLQVLPFSQETTSVFGYDLRGGGNSRRPPRCGPTGAWLAKRMPARSNGRASEPHRRPWHGKHVLYLVYHLLPASETCQVTN